MARPSRALNLIGHGTRSRVEHRRFRVPPHCRPRNAANRHESTLRARGLVSSGAGRTDFHCCVLHAESTDSRTFQENGCLTAVSTGRHRHTAPFSRTASMTYVRKRTAPPPPSNSLICRHRHGATGEESFAGSTELLLLDDAILADRYDRTRTPNASFDRAHSSSPSRCSGTGGMKATFPRLLPNPPPSNEAVACSPVIPLPPVVVYRLSTSTAASTA